MGSGSVFVDAIESGGKFLDRGAQELGLKESDAEKQKALETENSKLAAQDAAVEAEKQQAEDEADKTAEDKRRAGSRSRSSTLLTGGQGLTDSNLNVSRRTLLGS
jgi:hypothetical protein